MKINHKQYLNNENFYNTAIEYHAEKIENLIIERSWCNDDGKIDSFDYAIKLAQYELFKSAGDACLN